MLYTQRNSSRLSIAALGVTLMLGAAACGGTSEAGSKVATLGTTDTKASTADSTPQDTQDALLAYAACMRESGVDMADPTFDANGNPTGGGFGIGGDSGIDPQSDAFQTAQQTCGDLLQGVQFGGGQGGRFDRNEIQDSMNNFTACLRDNGLDVDDIDFANGAPGGGGGGPGNGGFGGGANNGSTEGQAPPAGGSAVPGGGFGGPPPNGGGDGGQGFDPTARIVEQLGLDADDPEVSKALDACKSILEGAFQQPGDDASNSTATTSS